MERFDKLPWLSWIVGALAATWDAAIGVTTLRQHRYTQSALLFVAVLSIVLINVLVYYRHKQVRAMRATRDREAARLQALLMEYDSLLPEQHRISEPHQKALANLLTVMKAVGAEMAQAAIHGRCFCVSMRVGKKLFLINSGYIREQTSGDETCYQVGTNMPEEEKIATALLLLHHNPKLFGKWRHHPGNFCVN